MRNAVLRCCCALLAALAVTGRLAGQQVPGDGPRLVHRDLEYGRVGSHRLLLDLYLPAASAAGPWPVVLWFHGQPGRKRPTPARRLVTAGYAVASIEYRSSRAAPFPAQLRDAQAAVRWVSEHGSAYGLDARRIAAWGESAGGHLAALLATIGTDSAGDSAARSVRPGRIQAAVVYFAPGRRGAASPLRYVSADDAPMLIVHGSGDRTVSPGRSERLHAALQEAGVASTLEIVPGARHDFHEAHTGRVDSLVRDFLARHLRSGAGGAGRP